MKTVAEYGFKTANQLADEVVKGLAELVSVKWYRNRSETEKLILSIKDSRGVSSILVAKGSHELYDSLKSIA